MVESKGYGYGKINPTQLLLNYMCEVGGIEEYNRLLYALDEIVVSLYRKNIRSNAFFHGCRADRNIRGETISNELWYWISNGFIKKIEVEDLTRPVKARIILQFTDKANNFLCQENIEAQINRNLTDETKGILKETIKSTIAKLPK